MLKSTYKVTIHLTCDGTQVFDDAVSDGKGKSAYDQVWAGGDVRIVGYSGKDYFIREGAICYAEIEKSTSEVAVNDTTCPADSESE